MPETQQSVSEWALQTFGYRDAHYRALMVLEEVVELCSAIGVPLPEMRAYFEKVAQKSAVQETGDSREEAADVLSTVYAFASTMAFDVHAELDRKMAHNRSRPQSYHDQKTAEKGFAQGGV